MRCDIYTLTRTLILFEVSSAASVESLISCRSPIFNSLGKMMLKLSLFEVLNLASVELGRLQFSGS